MSRVNLTELRRLHEAATQKGVFWREEVAFSEACKVYLPALLDELEAAREEVRKLTQSNEDLRKEPDRVVAEAMMQDGVVEGLWHKLEAAREEVREESNRWVSVIRGIDPDTLCDFHDEHGSQEYLKAWLAARDARMKREGAAEALEEIAKNAGIDGGKAYIAKVVYREFPDLMHTSVGVVDASDLMTAAKRLREGK